jgi:hypothetical protein
MPEDKFAGFPAIVEEKPRFSGLFSWFDPRKKERSKAGPWAGVPAN